MLLSRMSRVLVSWFGATDLQAAKGEASAGLGSVPTDFANIHRFVTKTSAPAKHFMVPVKDIEEKGYDLSSIRYKETVNEELTFEPPKKIIAKLKKLEAEIAKDLAELERML